MTKVLGRTAVLTLAYQRAAQREVLLTGFREFVRALAETGGPLGPYAHGDVFAQMRHELNEAEADLRPTGVVAARRSRKKISKQRRLRLYERDDFTCYRCGFRFDKQAVLSGRMDAHGHRRDLPRGGITLDHVVPESEGGASIDENLRTCCAWCNTEKGNSLLLVEDEDGASQAARDDVSHRRRLAGRASVPA